MANQFIDIDLHPRYSRRIVKNRAGDGLLVYGDLDHTVLVGRVESISRAVALLDGYDSILERRRKIVQILENRQKDDNDG